MKIEIRTVDEAALDGIIRAKADGLYMALAFPRRMLWRAADVRDGRSARYSGSFPEVIGWLFTRARVLPGRCRPKNRIVGQDNPWRVVAFSKRKDEK